MSVWRCGTLFGALLLAGLASTAGAREAAPSPPAEPPLMPPAGKKIDPWKLPADSLIEMTPEKLQELLDELARLKGKLKAPPARCRLLGGHVEDGVVLFKAEFDLHAERPDAVFALACGQAKARAAQQQDGRTPMLSADADGYLVQVDKPGDYTVTLELALPLSQRAGGGRGLELDLPRAAVTMLEMTLPPGARAPRVNGKDLADTVLTFDNGQMAGPLGPADKLDLAWQAAAPAGVGPLQTVHGRVTVRVAEEWMAVQADLTVHAQGGTVKTWVVVAPAGFDLKASAADQARVQIDRQEEPGVVRYIVRLRGPSDDDVALTATARTWLGDGKWKAVGPFQVPGAGRQSGEVLVSGGPDARLQLRPNEGLAPRDLTDDERHADPNLTAAYEYGAAPASQPWLEVQAAAGRGSVKTQESYALALVRPPGGGPPEWQATTSVTAAPSAGAAVDRLDVRLPAGCEPLLASPPEGVKSVDPDKDDPRLLHFQLNGAPTGPVVVSFKVRYVSPDFAALPMPRQAEFPLPRPVSKNDACTQIEVTVPDDVELAPSADADVKDAHKIVWRSPPPPDKPVAVSWQAYRPEVRVSSVIDLTLRGQTAEVQQELHLHFPRTAPKQLTLRTPTALGPNLQAVAGGALADEPAGAETRTLKLQGAGQQDQVVTLKYAFPIGPSPVPSGGRAEGAGPSFAVPLVTVDQTREGDARVRVWCGPGRLPAAPPGGDWVEKDIEEVKGVNHLPVLVLESLRPDAPLTLAFREPAVAAVPTVLVDRALFRARLDNDVWEVRAAYLIRQPADNHLDVELPDAPTALRLHVTLDGKEVDPETLEPAEAGGRGLHVVRLRLGADLIRKPAVLELAYRLPARGAWQYTLTPPLLVGDAGQAPTRWSVTLTPDAYVALAPEDGAPTRRTFGLRRGCLLAPQLAVTDEDLAQWFAGPDVAPPAAARVAPSLVCWQDAGQPLTVTFVPDWMWLGLCSVPLVLLGLLLFHLARRSYAGGRWAAVGFWAVILLLTPALAAAWAFRPTVLYAVAYGCEPGAAVLLLCLLFQAVLLERYRRRIVFLPSFRRARTGSSLVRAGAPSRAAGEPSTVDAPRSAGSSQQPA